MSELKTRIAYLQGLVEGLGLEKESKEGRVITAIIDVLEDLTQEMEEMTEFQAELESYIETIDEDLGDLEEEVYGLEGECDCGHDHYDQDDDEDFEDGNFVEVECPQCHDIVRFESSILADEDVIEVTCPNCDEIVYVNDEVDTLGMEND